VHVNAAARRDRGWQPRLAVGAKGYRTETTGVYTVR
jgi:hypothetical protein